MRYHTCFWYYFCIHTIYTISFALCKLRHATTDHIWPCRCRCNAWHVNVLCHLAGTLGFGVASFQGLCLLLSDGVFGFIRGLLWGRVEGYVFGTLYIWVISSRLKWAMCFFLMAHFNFQHKLLDGKYLCRQSMMLQILGDSQTFSASWNKTTTLTYAYHRPMHHWLTVYDTVRIQKSCWVA